MNKLALLGLAFIGLTWSQTQAQSISTLPLNSNNFCEGGSLTISYSVSNLFNSGNTFTAQLSDNSGSFSTPVAIGTLTTNASGNISAVIPMGTTPGSAYRIRVVGDNPAVIGTNNGSDIEIKAVPTVSFIPPADVCLGGAAVALTGGTGMPAGGTDVYTGQGVFGNTFYANLAGPGTFPLTYTYIAPNGCSASTSANISVYALPAVSLSPFTSVCSNDAPFPLSGGLPIGGTYTIDGQASVQLDPAAVGPGNHQIVYSYTDANGCSASASQYIFVNQPPVVSSNLPQNVCIGQLVNLFFSPSGGTLLVDGQPNAGSITPSTAGVLNVTYSYTDPISGCTTTSVDNITVNPLPLVSIPPMASYCSGAGYVVLDGGTPQGGIYSGPGVFNDSLLYPSLLSGTSTTVTYTYTNSNGCSASATQNITLMPAPTVSVTLPGSVCVDGGTVPLTGTPAGGVFSGLGVSGNLFDPQISGIGTFLITYTYTDANGCTASITHNMNVTNGTSPVVQLLPELCTNSSPVTFSSSPIGGIYSGVGVVGNTFDPTLAGPGNHEVIYTVTFSNGCIGYDTIMVTVNSLPVVSLTADTSNCINGTPLTLTGGSPAGGIYSGNGVNGNIFSPATAGVGSQQITYTYTDSHNCSASASTIIAVYALPQVTLDSINTVCNGTQIFNLGGGLPLGGTFSGTGVVGGSQFDPAISGSGNFPITYTYTDSNSCTNSATKSIAVVNLTVDAGFNQTISCGNTAQLNASVNYSGGATLNYVWQPALGLNSTTVANPVAAPGVNTTYTVLVSDGICNASDTVSVFYNPVSFGISFTAAPVTFNQSPPYVVTFNNPYAVLGQYNFTWIFGDGITQFNNAQDFSHTYYNNGIYNVILVAQDIVTGCIDSIPASFSINISGNNCNNPAFINQTGPIVGCSGSPVLLTTNEIPGATYQWYFNGTVIGGANTFSYNCFYNGTQLSYSGYYSVLVTDTANNCVSMSNNVQVVFNQPPAVPIITIIDPFDPCTPNNTATLQASSGYASYAWQRLIDPAIISTQQTITINQTGFYNVIVSDNNGCTNSANIPIANFGPDPSSVCFVSVDLPTQQNFIYWTNPVTSAQLESFMLLRKSDIQFGFDTIATIPYDPTATYYSYEDLDTISLQTWGNINDMVNPAAHYYTYGLALKDVCGGTSIPNSFHTTINLKVNTSNNGATFDLTWNAYGGLPFGVFELHKETTANPDLIFDNVSSNVFNYTDVNTAPDTVLAYWITVPLSAACDTARASIKSNSNKPRRDGIIINAAKTETPKTLKAFDIIPNPNSGNFMIELQNDFSSSVEIDIFTIMGTSVWNSRIASGKNHIKVDVPHLEQGVYMVQLTENNRKHYKKMIINK